MNDSGAASTTLPGLAPWTMSLVRPHRRAVVALSGLLLLQVALGAAAPWPFAIVVDYILEPVGPLPASVQPIVNAVSA